MAARASTSLLVTRDTCRIPSHHDAYDDVQRDSDQCDVRLRTLGSLISLSRVPRGELQIGRLRLP
jgi:hypothetical protein